MSLSEHKHTWSWDGDDPYLKCDKCGAIQDALTGRIVREGQS